MSLEHLDGSLAFIDFRLAGGPYVCFSILAATYDMLRIFTKRCMDLTARILVPLQLYLEAFVPKIVNTYPGIIAGDQELDFSIWIIGWIVDCLQARDLAAFGILPMR